MQVSYGREDYYGAFNGNFRVSSSDVNRDVKKVSVKANPPCSVLARAEGSLKGPPSFPAASFPAADDNGPTARPRPHSVPAAASWDHESTCGDSRAAKPHPVCAAVASNTTTTI